MLLIAAACLATVALIALSSRSNEPRYKGRSLTHWLLLYGEIWWEGGHSEPEDALVHIGTNALPYLLEWIRYEPQPSRFRTAARAFFDKAPKALAPEPLVRWACEDRAEAKAESAIYAFSALGPQVRPALPELFRLMTEPGASTNAVFRRTQSALHYTHSDDAVSLYCAYIANTNAPYRAIVAGLLGDCHLASNASPAIATLLRCLMDNDSNVVQHAGQALTEPVFSHQSLVPALTNCLVTSTNPLFRSRVIWVLGRVGLPMARPAQPLLLAALQDPDVQVRRRAAQALGEFGGDATNALPLLTNLLSEPLARNAASNAIWRITVKLTNAPAH
jgi:HEAT repeat protein